MNQCVIQILSLVILCTWGNLDIDIPFRRQIYEIISKLPNKKQEKSNNLCTQFGRADDHGTDYSVTLRTDTVISAWGTSVLRSLFVLFVAMS